MVKIRTGYRNPSEAIEFRRRIRDGFKSNRADDFVGLNTGGANKGALNCTGKINFYALQIREDFSKVLADNFGTGAAFFLFHTASFILDT